MTGAGATAKGPPPPPESEQQTHPATQRSMASSPSNVSVHSSRHADVAAGLFPAVSGKHAVAMQYPFFGEKTEPSAHLHQHELQFQSPPAFIHA